MKQFIQKKLIPFALSYILIFSVVPVTSAASGFGNFEKTRIYPEGQFTDVESNSWYHAYVKQAYELELMTGNSITTFNPNGNITFAEVITMASRIHMIYKGDSPKLEPESPWFWPYVKYAANNGIINSVDEYQNYTWQATRAQLAVIFSHALPDECYAQINDVTQIPDVPNNLPFFDEILKLYNAGIISGVDSNGSFNPYKNITRAEVATIVSNIALPELRKEFQLSSEILNTDTEDTVEEDVAKKEEPKLSVSQTNLTISKETTITVTATGDDITVVKACDSDIVETRWGDWIGDDLPLIITPKKNGTAIIKVYLKETPSEYKNISVTVTGVQAEADSSASNPSTSRPSHNHNDIARGGYSLLYSLLKNPSSLQIHGVWGGEGNMFYGNEYRNVVIIDYSAMNSFGGYNRSYFLVWYNNNGQLCYDNEHYTPYHLKNPFKIPLEDLF